MSETAQHHPKHLQLGSLLLISFATFNLGIVVDQTVRWSDHFSGFVNGLFHVLVFGIAWCVFLLPWSLVIFALYRWRRWRRFRPHWVLAPAVLTLLVSVGSLIIYPPTAANRFKGFAKTELPKNTRDLHFRFTGGGIADYGDTYYFQTTPDEVDRLIQNMGLSLDKAYGFKGNFNTSVEKIPGCPDFSTWEGAVQFKGHNESRDWFYYLITDSSKTRVYIWICCI